MNEPDAPEQAAGNGAADSEQDALRTRAESAERDRDQYLALAKSTRADFENYQKRIKRDQAEERKYACFDFALNLLPVIDNLERAIEAGKKAGETGPLVQGVGMVVAQLLEALKRHGVTRVEAEGKPFDPTIHQAIAQVPTAEKPPHTVLQVFGHGYMIHDRVLRPAQVAVSAGLAASGESSGKEE